MKLPFFQLFLCSAALAVAGCLGPGTPPPVAQPRPKIDVGPFDMPSAKVTSTGEDHFVSMPGNTPLLQRALIGGELPGPNAPIATFFGLGSDAAGVRYLVLGSDEKPEMLVLEVKVTTEPGGALRFEHEKRIPGERGRYVTTGTITPLAGKAARLTVENMRNDTKLINPLPATTRLWLLEATVTELEKKP